MNNLFKIESNEWRYERKYVYQSIHEHQLEREIMQSCYVFRAAYSARWVNSLYLDTIALTHFFANVDGLDQRVKCRVRWYGEFDSPNIKAQLEFKIKNGLVGTKQTYELKNFTAQRCKTVEGLRECLNESELPEAVRSYLLYAEPVLMIKYFRKYYISFDRKFRLTLDNKIEYSGIVRASTRSFSAGQKLNQIIVELKYDYKSATNIRPLFNGFPSRLSRNSKYVNALTALYPNLIST